MSGYIMRWFGLAQRKMCDKIGIKLIQHSQIVSWLYKFFNNVESPCCHRNEINAGPRIRLELSELAVGYE